MDGSGQLHAPSALPLERTPPRCYLVRKLGGPQFRRGKSLLLLSEAEPKIIGSHTADGANCLKDMAWYRVQRLGFQFM